MSATGSPRRLVSRERVVGRERDGFTLLELLVVLALIALIITALPVALRQVMPRQQLRVAEADVATQLREMQGRAARTGRTQEFREESAAELPGSIKLELLAAGEATLQVSAIEFHPDGSTSGGRVVLSAGERRRELQVSALTGRIRAVSR